MRTLGLARKMMINVSQPLETEPVMPSQRQPSEPSWSGVVKRIQLGDPTGMEELYDVFATGIRFYLCRQLGPQDLDDRVHDAFLTITQSIRKGDVREPDRLMGYVRTIVRRQVAAQIETVVEARRKQVDPSLGPMISDWHPNPESRVIEKQNVAMAKRILLSLPQRDREVLVRFYLHEQTSAEICREMGLTDTQFRLIKSRAKHRFGELGRARMARRGGLRPQG
jgi:RNA polymerase sigma-70 factor (ECF subfamily)